MQENQDIRTKESPSAKRSKYLNIPRFGASNFRFGGSIGSSTISSQGTMIGSWPRSVRFFQESPYVSFSCSSFAGSMWCPRCNRNHTDNCRISKQYFACGKLGHMRKDCSTLRGHLGASRRTGRRPQASLQQ